MSKLVSILKYLPDGILITNREEIVFINQKAAEILQINYD